MAHKDFSQSSLTSVLVRTNASLHHPLESVNQALDWTPFERLLSPIYAAAEGKPSFPLLLLFKASLLKEWHNLSDEALEASLDDRLSFRRFVGLPLEETAPDATVFCRFRQQLVAHNLGEALFEELTRQLDEKGLLVKKGTLVDATLLEAAVKRPSKREDGLPQGSKQDPDAEWATRPNGKTTFGYKSHIGVDEGSEFIRKAGLTGAATHDSQKFEACVSGDEERAYADKGYAGKPNALILQEKKVKNGIMRKAAKGRALTHWEKIRNRLISVRRQAVERVFGTWKRSYGYRQVRYKGLKKNELQMFTVCFVFNVKKLGRLERAAA